jgi:hypothetical protein
VWLPVGICLCLQGNTALMWAAGWRKAEAAVDYLLFAGATVNMKNKVAVLCSRERFAYYECD